MFGLSFSELILIVLVAIIVIGPKELPSMLRKAGRGAAKLRRMASDLRVQSGIDDVLNTEGLTQDFAEIRKLARGELDTHTFATSAPRVQAAPPAYADDYSNFDLAQLREREVPVDGVDTYGALPDTATVYDGLLVEAELAKDPLYVVGEPSAVVPPELPWRKPCVPPVVTDPVFDPSPSEATNGSAQSPADSAISAEKAEP